MTEVLKGDKNSRQATLQRIPKEVIREGEKYFAEDLLQNAVKFLNLSKVSISFSKGSKENYFICSGIIRDEHKNYQSKVIYKKRLENSEEGPITSFCDCPESALDVHCSHTASLFLSFILHQHYKTQFDQKDTSSSPTGDNAVPPSDLNLKEYGTIIGGSPSTEMLDGATDVSLRHFLHHHNIVNFPIPEDFCGKLIIRVKTRNKKSPIVRFEYKDEAGNVNRKISIFENLYLFKWDDGRAYHFPNQLKDLIQKLRFAGEIIEIDDIVRPLKNQKFHQVETFIDGQTLDEMPVMGVHCRVYLKEEKNASQIKFRTVFYDEKNNLVKPPHFLTAFTFQGGWLESFPKRKDAYEFIVEFAKNIRHGSLKNYTKYLISSSKKENWQNLIDHLSGKNDFYFYNSKMKYLCRYDVDFLIMFYEELVNCFGEMLFRSSKYLAEKNEIVFAVNRSTLFHGLSKFFNVISPKGVQIFYNKIPVIRWDSQIRFERKASAIEWLDLDLNISDVDLEVVKKANIASNISITKSGLVLLNTEQEILLEFIKKNIPIKGKKKPASENKFSLSFNRMRIFELFELHKMGVEGALTDEEVELCEKLATMEEMPKFDIPGKFEKILRPYQKTGYNWLRFLYENRFGACLADDMGLGKTLQTIVFLKSIYHQIDSVLIVSPVTILLNWEKEFKKFSDISVHIYHGENRNLATKSKIILTSYGIMKKEATTTFADKFFDVFILDEVQHLKNIRSQGANAAREIKSKYRICLTGTPLENDIVEFYNIMDLSVPGIWGSMASLREASLKNSHLFTRKTAGPFILRRSKSQVLTELPPKIENNVFLHFSDIEKVNYADSLLKIKAKVNSAGSNRRYGEILQGLLHLRQKCLWQKRKIDASFSAAGVDSTKIKFLIETLDSIIEEGHQAIVFSQFTTYLDIIQSILKEKKWKIARIDGSQTVKHRQKEIDKFQENNYPVFLISLRAGGIGLNLTAASYVFIMDPWWNPAVEAQAIDRAYRIGQKNSLTVYKLIMKGSVEEKILELQQNKRELFASLLPEDDQNFFTGKLTMKDFESLFQ